MLMRHMRPASPPWRALKQSRPDRAPFPPPCRRITQEDFHTCFAAPHWQVESITDVLLEHHPRWGTPGRCVPFVFIVAGWCDGTVRACIEQHSRPICFRVAGCKPSGRVLASVMGGWQNALALARVYECSSHHLSNRRAQQVGQPSPSCPLSHSSAASTPLSTRSPRTRQSGRTSGECACTLAQPTANCLHWCRAGKSQGCTAPWVLHGGRGCFGVCALCAALCTLRKGRLAPSEHQALVMAPWPCTALAVARRRGYAQSYLAVIKRL